MTKQELVKHNTWLEPSSKSTAPNRPNQQDSFYIPLSKFQLLAAVLIHTNNRKGTTSTACYKCTNLQPRPPHANKTYSVHRAAPQHQHWLNRLDRSLKSVFPPELTVIQLYTNNLATEIDRITDTTRKDAFNWRWLPKPVSHNLRLRCPQQIHKKTNTKHAN